MIDERYVEYIRANKDKYPMESLKQALVKAGLPPAAIEEAVSLASLPPAPARAPIVPPAPAPTAPSTFGAAPVSAVSSPAAASSASQAFDAESVKSHAQGIFSQAIQVLMNPAEFFRTMPKTGGWQDPLWFVVTMLLTGMVLRAGLTLVFNPSFLPGSIFERIVGILVGLILFPIGAVIGFAIGAAIAHVIWMILGTKQPFETSCRCLAYMSAVFPIQMAVQTLPMFGMWLAIPVGLYGIYLFLPASTEAHGIERGKAVIVVSIFACIALLLSISSALVAWKMRNLASALREGNSPLSALQSLNQSGSSTQGASPQQAAALQQILSQMGKNQPANQATPGQQGPANLPQAASQAMAALGANPNIQAVAGADLKSLLPASLPGMKLVSSDNSKSAVGQMQFSQAKVVYRSDDGKSVTLTIADMGSFAKIASMAWSMTDFDRETDASFDRTLSYRGGKAHEMLNKTTGKGLFETVVADRFMVKADGDRADEQTLKGAVDQVNFSNLQSLSR